MPFVSRRKSNSGVLLAEDHAGAGARSGLTLSYALFAGRSPGGGGASIRCACTDPARAAQPDAADAKALLGTHL